MVCVFLFEEIVKFFGFLDFFLLAEVSLYLEFVRTLLPQEWSVFSLKILEKFLDVFAESLIHIDPHFLKSKDFQTFLGEFFEVP